MRRLNSEQHPFPRPRTRSSPGALQARHCCSGRLALCGALLDWWPSAAGRLAEQSPAAFAGMASFRQSVVVPPVPTLAHRVAAVLPPNVPPSIDSEIGVPLPSKLAHRGSTSVVLLQQAARPTYCQDGPGVPSITPGTLVPGGFRPSRSPRCGWLPAPTMLLHNGGHP